MVFISAISTFALYCQQCGKIHLHELSHFCIKKTELELKCSCSHVQATLSRVGSRQFLLSIPCVACQSTHNIFIDRKNLLRTAVDKVYCIKDNFELGYLGDKNAIAETLAAQKREGVSLIRESDSGENDELIEKQHIVLGILNRVHDIAEQGGVYCRCGSDAVEADLLPDHILLECLKCGSYYTIAAQTEHDLQAAQTLDSIELLPQRYYAKKIDCE